MKPRFHAVLFDAGETLIGPRESFGAVYARVLGALGVSVPSEALERGLRASWATIDREIPAGTDRYRFFPGGESAYWLRFVEGVFAHTEGLGPDPALARRALPALRDAFSDPAAWQVYPDVEPALAALEDDGIATAVVSNWDSRLRGLLARLGLDRRFGAIVVSAEHGAEKPDPSIFREALGRIGADAAATLHVGDVPALDLAGSRAAGIECLLVDRFGRLDPSYGAADDLRSLPEIARAGLGRATGV